MAGCTTKVVSVGGLGYRDILWTDPGSKISRNLRSRVVMKNSSLVSISTPNKTAGGVA